MVLLDAEPNIGREEIREAEKAAHNDITQEGGVGGLIVRGAHIRQLGNDENIEQWKVQKVEKCGQFHFKVNFVLRGLHDSADFVQIAREIRDGRQERIERSRTEAISGIGRGRLRETLNPNLMVRVPPGAFDESGERLHDGRLFQCRVALSGLEGTWMVLRRADRHPEWI
jgi:hypothetical protein